jgi:putative transposase
MSKKMIKQYSPALKLKVILEVLKEEETISQIGSKYEINPKNIQNWRKEFLENAELAFNKEKVIKEYKERLKSKETENEELYKTIGKLTSQLNWAEKKIKESGLIN